MKDYWLAKLVASVEKVDSRKRLQKSIYLLQGAGGPLRCDYILHYYGPYSFELAGLIDQLDSAEIIEEKPTQLGGGMVRYSTEIKEKGRRVINSFEESETGKKAREQIESFLPRFKRLTGEDLWVLELAATVRYYYDDDWNEAQVQTATFKRIRKDDRQLKRATSLAREFIGEE